MSTSKRKHPKNKSQSKRDVSARQLVVEQRITQLGSQKKNESGKAKFPYCTKRLLLAFARFIDNPHCYSGQLHDLYYCQSTVYGLQKRQRETCVKVMVAMCCDLEVETHQIGKPQLDYMDTITHQTIMRNYEACWGEPISEKRYYHAIKLFKMADFLVIDAVYLQDRDLLANLDLKDEDLPRVYSKPAYKTVTQKFINIFGLDNDEDVKKSKSLSIAKRIKKGLKTLWVRYEAFSDAYIWKKRQRPTVTRTDTTTQQPCERYPQGRVIMPSIFGGNYTTEH
ncbi:hypothetical protein VXS06_17695 [Photobacterium toruni]|uniref:Uncharacterized protein n=1 Tax=Photobacterium toruni TaxID=1935446 RepID=A0ABU6LAL5_9GAMM|nr:MULTISPECIES: hypothetical protein [Photobacterium]MEC6833601.1 hypothetical protein [Photobacterium toruni]MEC6909676.1 hypothetical protein [Photobacterium piscicola]